MRDRPRCHARSRGRDHALREVHAKAYPDSAVASDASEAQGGYLENGTLDSDAYAASGAMVDLALKQTYRGLNGQPLHVAKCLDLLGTEEMDTLVFRYVK
jgi:hypothetical protein